jgi:hypothetical protein
MREKAVVTLHPCGGSGIQRGKYQFSRVPPKTWRIRHGSTENDLAARYDEIEHSSSKPVERWRKNRYQEHIQ